MLYFFVIIYFQTYKILIIQWKHGISPNDIITFNKVLEFISTSIIKLVNIDESSHEEAVVILITNKYLNKTKKSCNTEYDDGN